MRLHRRGGPRRPGSARALCLIALAVAAVFGLASCGGTDQSAAGVADDGERSIAPASPSERGERPSELDRPPSELSAPANPAGAGNNAREEPEPPRVKRARCPGDATNCASATGRIVFVEAVDPDGDGDAHFVLLSSDNITAPGVSVIDVRRDLRPDPLPGVGDSISAAGPVFPGSYGQSQIQADELHVAGR